MKIRQIVLAPVLAGEAELRSRICAHLTASSGRSRTRPPGPLFCGAPAPIEIDPAIVTELIGRNQASMAASERDIRTKCGEVLLDFIQADVQEL